MLGARLKAAREALGLTQHEAGRLADLERNTLARYELGRREPTLRALRALAKVYGRPPEWFLSEDDSSGISWDRLGDGFRFEGKAALAVAGTPVLRGGFSDVVGGISLEFVCVGLVASEADAGWDRFDDTVVGMVPFAAEFFDSSPFEPNSCSAVRVGQGSSIFSSGSVVLVDRSVNTFLEAECLLVLRWDGLVVRRVWSRGGWDCYQEGDGWVEVRPGDRVIGVVRWVGRRL